MTVWRNFVRINFTSRYDSNFIKGTCQVLGARAFLKFSLWAQPVVYGLVKTKAQGPLNLMGSFLHLLTPQTTLRMFTKSTQYSAVNPVSLTISTNFICDNKFNAERLSFRMLDVVAKINPFSMGWWCFG